MLAGRPYSDAIGKGRPSGLVVVRVQLEGMREIFAPLVQLGERRWFDERVNDLRRPRPCLRQQTLDVGSKTWLTQANTLGGIHR